MFEAENRGLNNYSAHSQKIPLMDPSRGVTAGLFIKQSYFIA